MRRVDVEQITNVIGLGIGLPPPMVIAVPKLFFEPVDLNGYCRSHARFRANSNAKSFAP